MSSWCQTPVHLHQRLVKKWCSQWFFVPLTKQTKFRRKPFRNETLVRVSWGRSGKRGSLLAIHDQIKNSQKEFNLRTHHAFYSISDKADKNVVVYTDPPGINNLFSVYMAQEVILWGQDLRSIPRGKYFRNNNNNKRLKFSNSWLRTRWSFSWNLTFAQC